MSQSSRPRSTSPLLSEIERTQIEIGLLNHFIRIKSKEVKQIQYVQSIPALNNNSDPSQTIQAIEKMLLKMSKKMNPSPEQRGDEDEELAKINRNVSVQSVPQTSKTRRQPQFFTFETPQPSPSPSSSRASVCDVSRSSPDDEKNVMCQSSAYTPK